MPGGMLSIRDTKLKKIQFRSNWSFTGKVNSYASFIQPWHEHAL